MLSEEIYGETILSYIISTFMDLYKSSTILRRLLKVNTEIDVEYLKPAQTIPSDRPTKQQTKPKDDESSKRFRFDSKGIEAGKKTRAYVEKETKRLEEIKLTQEDLDNDNIGRYDGKKVGDRKYTDEDVHRMVGFRKTQKTKYRRTARGDLQRDKDGKPIPYKATVYEKYKPSLYKNLEETKKSLDNLLIVLGEEDNILIKEDVGIILESLNKRQKKKIKAILNIADPTEYFGHDFLKLSELIRLLRTLGVVKGDKKLNKKVLRLDDENIKVVKLATRLRKDYENLYRKLREMIYPKSGE